MTDPVVLRDAVPDDLDWWAALRVAWHDNWSFEDYRARLVLPDAGIVGWRVAEKSGERVGGWVALEDADGARNVQVTLVVAPSARGAGLGRVLGDDLVARLGDQVLEVCVVDGDEAGLPFAESLGFVARTHSIHCQVDLQGDRRIVAPATRPGLEVLILDDHAFDRSGLDITGLLAHDDSPEARLLGWHMSPEALRRIFPALVWAVVMEGDLPVALVVVQPESTQRWWIVFTVVRRERRGRGLARLLKQHVQAYAADQGVAVLAAENEESNATIRALNEDLGYVVIGGHRFLVRPADGGSRA